MADMAKDLDGVISMSMSLSTAPGATSFRVRDRYDEPSEGNVCYREMYALGSPEKPKGTLTERLELNSHQSVMVLCGLPRAVCAGHRHKNRPYPICIILMVCVANFYTRNYSVVRASSDPQMF